MAYSDNNNTPVNKTNKDKYRNSADLLPLFFRTESNKKFLGSTLDSFISKGQLERLNGFVGSRATQGVKPSDQYIPEPTKNRRRYNLLPGVVIKDDFQDRTDWSGTYDDLINQLDFFNANTSKHNRLFDAKYYAWNPHIDFDKFVNYRQYYWLPNGPNPVTVTGSPEGTISTFSVTNQGNESFIFTPDGATKNPLVVLYRGATYKFEVNAPGHPFYIKNAKTTGTSDQYTQGVINNGAQQGTVVFTVPITAPDNLYYTCGNHQTMQGILEIKNAEDELSIDIPTEIIGKVNYTSSNGVVFTNGLKVNFAGDVTPSTYKNKNYYVEGVGKEIKLVPESELDTPEVYSQNFDYEFDIDSYDDTPFDDAENYPLNPEYITINRSSIDKNAWSRYNRWFHKDVLEKSAELNNTTVVLDENSRAKRPIIEFQPNLQLYNSATVGLGNVDLIDTVTTDAFSDVEGQLGYYVDEVLLLEGMRVTFNADTDITVKGKIYKVEFVEHGGKKRIHLEEENVPLQGQGIVVTQGENQQGSSWYFDGTQWVKGQQKTSLNQSPLFDLYDVNGISFSDSTYGIGSFQGNEIVSYKIGSGSNDSVLGFPLTYQNIANVGDIVFEFDWDDSSFTYNNGSQNATVDTARGLLKVNKNLTEFNYENGWTLVKDKKLKQPIVQINDTFSDTSIIEISSIKNAVNYVDEMEVVISYDEKILKQNTDFTVAKGGVSNTNVYVNLTSSIPADKRIVLKIFTEAEPAEIGYYEAPKNLTNNSENNDLQTFTLGSVTDHFRTIIENDSRVTGILNGVTNARDIDSIYSFGTRYIKHQGSLLPAIFSIVDGETNVVKAIRRNAQDYNLFKQQFLQLSNKTNLDGDDPISDVDKILYELGLNRTPGNSYFYSDMAGYGRSVSKLVYTVKSATQKVFGINTNYNLTQVSDRAVYVYLNDEHLIANIDYEFDTVDNTVTINRDVNIGDVVKINDYSTVGNVIPNTPTKLGLYPKFKPRLFNDDTFVGSPKILEGHDGSKTLAYNDYRDDLLLELEKRIYNNIKVNYNRSVFDLNDYIPGAFRKTEFNLNEFTNVLKDDFGYWANFYDIEYLKNNVAVESEPFTYNYSRAIDTIIGERLPGYWKGIYKKFFDTDRPHTAPWEMLGYSEKPTWWENRYGPAPYTSGNDILWNDLEKGYDYGIQKVNPTYARSGLNKIIPVNEYGDLKSPIQLSIVKNFVITSITNDFIFGDNGPAEYSWRSSSWYPYAIQLAIIFTKPAQYLTTMFDTAQNFINSAENLVYKDSGKIIDFTDVKINELYYDNVRFKGAGYHVFITDYIKSFGLDIKQSYRDRLTATSMNLIYKLGGFAEKNRLRCLLESSNPLSADTSVFLPQENYELYYKKSNPINTAKASGVIVEKTGNGYKVSGYDKYQPVFKIYKPKNRQTDPAVNVGGVTAKFVQWQEQKFYGTGQIVQYQDSYYRVKVDHTTSTTFDNSKYQSMSELPLTGGASAQIGSRFESVISEIPYNTVLNRAQDVVDLLVGYGHYLESIGFVFDQRVNELGELQNWTLSSKEFLYWTTQNFSVGSVITLSPFATQCKFRFSDSQVDNVLDSFYEYSLLNAGGNPLPSENISTTRQSGEFTLRTKNTNQGLYNIQLNLVQKEHVIVFDDKTVFGDIIYDQEAGYRQQRIKLVGFKTSEWNGDLYSPGFTYDEAQIENWVQYKDYNLGDVVKHKAKFYSANKFLPGSETFDNLDWQLLGDKPIAELLPNFDFKISSFQDFYNLDSETFDVASAQLSQHLLGYQKRTYLDNLIKNDTAQYKFYQGYIKEKGTQNALEKISRIQTDGVLTDIDFDEEWAFKQGSLGSSTTTKEIEFILDESQNIDNPQAYEFVNNASETEGNVIGLTPGNLLIKPDDYTNTPWPVTTLDKSNGITSDYLNKIPVAGFARTDQELITAFDFDDMVNNQIIESLNVGDSVWVAKDPNNDWNVYTLMPNPARVINTDNIKPTLDDTTVTYYTDIKHNLTVGQLISIKNFIPQLNGVAKVSSIPSSTSFTVTGFIVANLNTDDSSTGEILEFISTRVDTPDDINNIEYITEFPNDTKAYADDNGTGKWSVYQKTEAFTEEKWGAPNDTSGQKFGFNVATGDNGRLIVVSSPNFGDEGQIYVLRREFNTDIATLQTVQGYAISDNSSDNIVTDAGRPALGFSLAVSSDASVIASGAPKASNFKAVDDSSRVGFRVSVGDFSADPSPFTKEGVVTLHTLDVEDNLYKRNYIIGSSDPQVNSHFGQSVLVSATKLIVGAPGQNNYQGKVFIYDKVLQSDGSTLDWDLSDHHELYIPNSRDGDQFGYSLAGTSDLSIIAVSAIGREAVGDDSSASKGAVYIYKLSGRNEYELLQTIDTNSFSEITSGDQFGYKIALNENGQTLVITAPFSDSDNVNAGSVYYFDKTGDDSSIDLYSFVQRISSPKGKTQELFGANIAVNPAGDGIAVFSQGGQNRVTTTFDKFTRLADSSLAQTTAETTFDSEATSIVDENFASGTVYTYTKLYQKFVFGQKIDSPELDEYDAFGQGLAYTSNTLLVGAPENSTGNPRVDTGSLFAFKKTASGWNPISVQDNPTQPDLIKKVFTYNKETDTVKDFLEVIDPAKGKISYLADSELTYKTDVDPAIYSIGLDGVTVNARTAWGSDHVGELWWDLSTVRYVWYEQGDTEYRNNNWGTFFPGSSIDVYEWVETNLTPAEWDRFAATTVGQSQGITGVVKDEGDNHVRKQVYNRLTGAFEERYYFWVKNIVTVPDLPNRRLPALEVANIIADPQAYGIKSIHILGNNSLAVQNIKTTLDDKNVVMCIQYKNIENDLPSHNEWNLLRPKQYSKIENTLLNKKLIDSLVGYDDAGNQVPDGNLTPQRKYGIQIRPRQTMFVDRLKALETAVIYINDVMAKERIVDTKNIDNLSAIDPQPGIITGKYDLKVDEYEDLSSIGTQDLVQATATASIVNGRITSVAVNNQGFGYGVSPEVKIIGDGTGAKLKASIDATGKVTGIEVLKKGENYSYATIVIRKYRVLVDIDSTANNFWSIYEFNSTTKLWDRVTTQTYDLNRFWSYKDWIVEGFNTDSIIDYKIEGLFELGKINPNFGEYVEVKNMGDGNRGILQRVVTDGTFGNSYDIVYKEKSTIQINENIYNYELLNFGFAGLENFDLNQFDSEPIQETRLMLEVIKNDIFVDDLKLKWNDLFFVMLRYVFTEQNFVDWAFKTSFITVKNNLGGFSNKSTYKLSDPGYFEEYIKEVKPFKSTIREYITGYSQLENNPIGTTDFDLPSYWDEEQQKFVIPNLTDEEISTQPYVNWFDNYKYTVGSIKVTNQGAGYTEPPLVVISGGRENKPKITQTQPFRSLVTTDYTGSRFYTKTTSIPDHGFVRNVNNNEVTVQNFVFEFPRTAIEAQTKIQTPDQKAIGVAVNGVLFYNPVGVDQENRNNISYTINNVTNYTPPDVRDGSGSVGEDGVYYYHADPARLYDKDDTSHSPLIGFALDGYPIYGPYGYDDPKGNINPRIMKSSYQLRTVPRADGTMPDGKYIEDFAYVVGSGDLDEHNGRTCVTPDYPNGTYAYFVTVDSTDITVPVYPYIIGPTYYGVPILPNGNKTLPNDDVIDATATAYTSRGIVREIIVNNQGNGYVSSPTITLAGGGGADAVTETATAYALLENKKVRINTVNMKFDRLASSKVIQTQQQTDTFTATSGQIKFKLTYLPTLDKREINININNETVYIETYDVSIVTVTDATYSKKEGYIIFNTPPGAGASVNITYKKSINLMQATDRIEYYYQPTAGMLGKDPAQLMTGVEYDGVQVQGLEFDISVGWDGLPWMSHGWDTFSGTNTDYAFRADGSTQTFTLPYVPESGQEINVYFDGIRQDPTNTATIVGDGTNDTFTLDIGAPDGTLVVFRQKESDGSLVPTDVNNLDSIISGGNFAYTTATGNKPEDISLDGDGFVTVDTSHAPEEVVPGQAFDSVVMSVYNAPADGSPLIETVRYWGNSLTKTFSFNLNPGTQDSIYVTVAGEYKEQGSATDQYTINWSNKTITFTDAPEIDELVTIQTLNIAGSSILERETFTGDGSTTEFELTSKYEDVNSAFTTVNGEVRGNVIREADTGSAIIDINNPPPVSGSVIQIVGLSSSEKTYSEITKEVITDDGSTTSYTLTNIPGNIAPYHAMAIVEMKDPATNIVTRLRAPDTVYYTNNGITQDYLVSQDPGYSVFSLALGEIEVHLNGTRLVPIRDYNFDTATNIVSFNENVLTSGDAIAITVLRDHEYEITVSGDSAGDTEATLTILVDRSSIPANAEYYVTTFTNHDANLIRKEVFRGSSGGTYSISRPALDSNYVWVEVDGVPLVADRDYKVQKNSIVYIDDKISQAPSSRVVVTSFSEEASYDTIGYKIFKDMLNRTHFKRISEQDSTTLATALEIKDESITLTDASFLQTPNPDNKIPGVIWIDRERIEFYTINGNTLGQITRGTLGTGIKNTYTAGTVVFDGGPNQTVPYSDTVNTYTSIIRPGLPNGRKEHVLETINISNSTNAHDQVEVYLGGRKLQKPTPLQYLDSNGEETSNLADRVSDNPRYNPIKHHDIEIAFDSDETNSVGTSSDVLQQAEFTVVPVGDSSSKNYYKLVLRDEPQDGTELKVIQKQGKVWYEQGLNSASTGTTLQRAETAQAKFLLERTSGLPVINIRE